MDFSRNSAGAENGSAWNTTQQPLNTFKVKTARFCCLFTAELILDREPISELCTATKTQAKEKTTENRHILFYHLQREVRFSHSSDDYSHVNILLIIPIFVSVVKLAE